MTYILSLSYLNDACFQSLNEDDKKYQMCLKIAQDMLKEILGAEFYEEIESQYPNYTGDNSSLYDPYIKDYLAWQTVFNYQKFVNYNATPTGNREFIDENSTVLSDVKQYAAEKNILQWVNHYKGLMLTFLDLEQDKDPTAYPLYNAKCDHGFNFAITSVDKASDALVKVNKTIISNE